MTTSIKITALNNIGSNIAPTTLVPVVDMAGVPTTEKANLQIVGNLILSGAGGANFASAAQAINAQTVSNAAQPSITSVGTLSNLVVSGNVSVNGNISSNGTAFVGNLSTTGLASITTLSVGATANLGAIGNIVITGGTAGQILSTDGAGNLSWASDATSYGNSNVAAYLPTYTGNLAGDYLVLTHDVGANVVSANYLSGDGSNISNLDVGNIASINLDGNSQTWLAGNGVFSNIAIPTVGNIATLNLDGNTSNVLHGDGSWSADTTTYGNSNVVTLLSSFGSNTITTTGNVSVGNIIGNGQGLTGIAGANVGGFVPNANVANTAFAVAAANVSGLGNIATINLDGNVSNLLTGNGTYVAIPTVGNIATINLDGNSQTWLAGNGAFANIAIPTVGNIATINLTGSNSDVLYGNGVFAAVAGGANTGNVTFDNINVIGTGNLHLQPDPANSGSYLDIFLSSGPDLHLVASASANLILGKDDQANVMTSWNGNVYVQSWDTGTNTQGGVWTFGGDGNLTFPGNLVIAGNTSVFGTNASLLQTTDDRPLLALSSGANGAVSSIWVEDVANVGTSNIAAVYANPTVGSGIVRIAVGQNGNAGPNLWDFGTDGNLTIPGTSGGFIKTVSNASIGVAAVDNGTNNPAQLLSINAGSGAATSIVSAYATNATIQTNAAGNINTWSFDNAGNLTLPTGGQIIVSGGLVSSGASPAPTINGFSITNSVGISGNGNIAGGNISASGNITANNLGNISSINIDGSNSNVLYGNGVFAAVAGGGYGNSNVATFLASYGSNTMTTTGNVSVGNILGNGYYLTGVRPQVTATNSGGALNIMLATGSGGSANAVVGIGTSGGPATINPGTGQLVVAGATVGGYGLSVSGGGTPATGTITATGNITGANLITGGVVSATGNVSGNFFLGNGSQLTGITATSLVNGTSNVVTTSNGNVTIGIAGNASIATFTGTGANVTGTLDVTGNVTVQGVGTNLVRRNNTISGSNTVVTLDNLTALVGGTPTRLFIGAATSNMTMAGTAQTMISGGIAVSSWINVPIVTGTGNGFAMSGAISSAGDTVVLNVTDQGAGSGTWRVTGMIANTSANLYSVSIERLA